jgi:hypothetical protein
MGRILRINAKEGDHIHTKTKMGCEERVEETEVSATG